MLPAKHWHKLKLLDVAILLYAVHRGAGDTEVGFEDARLTLQELTRMLNKPMSVSREVLESCLWSASLLDEAGKWEHPQGLTFDEWVKGMLGKEEFNRIYHLIGKSE